MKVKHLTLTVLLLPAVGLLSAAQSTKRAKKDQTTAQTPALPPVPVAPELNVIPASELAQQAPVPEGTLVQTNLNHVSIIELPEPVENFTCGSEDIQVESKDNHIALRPLKPGVETNLIVWTHSMKQVYEILPAGDPRGDLYVKTALPNKDEAAKAEERAKEDDQLILTALGHTRIIDSRALKMDGKQVDVLIRSVTETKDSFYVRIAVRNSPNHPYSVVDPVVEYLEPSFAAGTPMSYIGQMIPDAVLQQFGFYTTTQLPLRSSTLQPTTLAPKQYVQWEFAFKKPHKVPGIFRFRFPTDDGSSVSATAVF